jgi:hypothetical protein
MPRSICWFDFLTRALAGSTYAYLGDEEICDVQPAVPGRNRGCPPRIPTRYHPYKEGFPQAGFGSGSIRQAARILYNVLSSDNTESVP